MAKRGPGITGRLVACVALGVALTAAAVGLVAVRSARVEVASVGDDPRTLELLRQHATESVTLAVVTVSGICMAASASLAFVVGRGIVRRVRAVTERADQISRGRVEGKIGDAGTDEVAQLAATLDYMTEHLVVVVGRAEERVRRATEQAVARAIQQEILPAGDVIHEGRLALAGCVRPSAECGADFWSWHELGDQRVLVVVGAATGHGVNAVLVAAAAKAACDAVRAARGPEVELPALLEAMNGAVFLQARRRMNVTCFASILDAGSGRVTHANAGHAFPYHLRGGDAGEFSALKSRGNRLGESRESRWEPAEAALEAADTLIWYTDGVLHNENQQGERYGDKRLRAAVRRSLQMDVGPLRDRVVSDVLEFCGAMPPKDDLTVVIGKIS